MARKRRLNENKKNIIASLIEEYGIQTAADVQEALKDLLGGTIQEMMEAELDNHLGYKSYERSDNPDYRNGTKSKTLRSTVGEIPIAVPKDRDGDFEPKVVPKYKKDISDIESKVISLSAKGLTTRQISSVKIFMAKSVKVINHLIPCRKSLAAYLQAHVLSFVLVCSNISAISPLFCGQYLMDL